jgi:predicted Zn finger-like uncharacterized protein
MPLATTCPHCQHAFRVPDKMTGRTVRCPACERSFQAEGAARRDSEPSAEVESATRTSARVKEPAVASAAARPPSTMEMVLPELPAAPPEPRVEAAEVVKGDAHTSSTESAGLQRPRLLTPLIVLALLALVLGLVGTGVAWTLAEAGLVCGGAGLLLGTAAASAIAARKAPGLPIGLAAIGVNVLALAGAALNWELPVAPPAPPVPAPPLAELRQALKAPNPDARRAAAAGLGQFGADLPAVVAELAEALKDPAPEVRTAAAEALGKAGPAARLVYGDLLLAKADTNPATRAAVAEALTQVGRPSAADVPALLLALKLPQPACRAAAAQVLGMIGQEPRISPALREALRDRAAAVRVQAAFSLARVQEHNDEAVPVLLEALAEADARVKAVAAYALGALHADGPDVVPALAAALKAGDARVREKAAFALGVLADTPAARKAAPALAEAVRQEWDPWARVHQALALLKIPGGAQSPGLAGSLAALLKVDQAEVREAAAAALGEMGPAARDALPALRTALKDANPIVRTRVVMALPALRPEPGDVVPELLHALDERDEGLRVAAAYALARLGPAAREAAPELHRRLVPGTPLTVRLWITHALWEIDHQSDEVLRVALAALREDPSPAMRKAAADILAPLGPLARPAVPDLCEALKHGDAGVRAAAARALGEVGPAARVVYPLLAALAKAEAEEPAVKEVCAAAAAKVGRPGREDVVNLVAALGDAAHPDYRATAVFTLYTLGKQAREAARALGKALGDKSTEVQKQALAALEELGPDAAPAVEDLRAAFKVGDPVFKARAADVLGKIGPKARAAVEELRGALKSDNLVVEFAVARALVAIDKAHAREALKVYRRALAEDEESLRVAAAGALAQLGPDAREAVPDLAAPWSRASRRCAAGRPRPWPSSAPRLAPRCRSSCKRWTIPTCTRGPRPPTPWPAWARRRGSPTCRCRRCCAPSPATRCAGPS